MGRTCKAFDCTGGYLSERKEASKNNVKYSLKIFGFPSDKEQCEIWIRALPNTEIRVEDVYKNNNIGVCERHWPSNYPTVKRGNHNSPANPPTVFAETIPPSCLSTPAPPPRPTRLSSSKARNPDIGQTKDHKTKYNFASQPKGETLSRFLDELGNVGRVAVSKNDDDVVLKSKGRNGPIFDFIVCFSLLMCDSAHGPTIEKVTFEVYSGVRHVTVPFLKNRFMTDFTELEALLNFVKHIKEKDEDSDKENDIEKKQQFIERQIEIINLPKNSRVYNQNDFCIAFSWYAQSRSLYNQMRDYLTLPSNGTLLKLTALAKHTQDVDFFKGFFSKQDPRSRGFVLLVDEIYVKASIIYSGTLFIHEIVIVVYCYELTLSCLF